MDNLKPLGPRVLESTPNAPVGAWTDEQCLQFAAVAFRHSPKNLPNGVTLQDIRMAAASVFALAQQPVPPNAVAWHPIETAPKDNKRPLYLAQFNTDTGELIDLDWDASWEAESESWEIPQVYYIWRSANGRVEEPTHWAYQDLQQPVGVEGLRRMIEKLAAHVRPTCSELWEEAQAALAAQHQEDRTNG